MKQSIQHNKIGFNDKLFGAMAYIWILFLIPLLLKNNNQLVQFHAKQGMLLFICWLIGWLFFWLPFVGALLYLAIILISALGIIAVIQGRYWEIPVIGRYAQKIKF